MILQKAILLILLLGFIVPVSSQNELNSYKYIVVPIKYDFLKKENQYRVNSYTKYLFDKEGYQAFYQGDGYPDDLRADPCLAVTAYVLNESNAFTTKIFIVLKNCQGEVVLQTVEGRSKIKQFEKTYIDALKKCFVTIQELDYAYDPEMISKESEAVRVAESEKREDKVTTAPVAVAVPVVTQKNQTPEKITKESEVKPVSATEKNKVPAAVIAAPIVVNEEVTQSQTKEEAPVVAKTYKNDTITFLLINQGAQLQAYVTKSAIEKYQQGELIGTFEKTSLPNVFRVAWKKPEKDIDQTTAYFDDLGNLKIDIHRNGKIEVITFTEVK